jgi:hypothetical protein
MMLKKLAIATVAIAIGTNCAPARSQQVDLGKDQVKNAGQQKVSATTANLRNDLTKTTNNLRNDANKSLDGMGALGQPLKGMAGTAMDKVQTTIDDASKKASDAVTKKVDELIAPVNNWANGQLEQISNSVNNFIGGITGGLFGGGGGSVAQGTQGNTQQAQQKVATAQQAGKQLATGVDPSLTASSAALLSRVASSIGRLGVTATNMAMTGANNAIGQSIANNPGNASSSDVAANQATKSQAIATSILNSDGATRAYQDWETVRLSTEASIKASTKTHDSTLDQLNSMSGQLAILNQTMGVAANSAIEQKQLAAAQLEQQATDAEQKITEERRQNRQGEIAAEQRRRNMAIVESIATTPPQPSVPIANSTNAKASEKAALSRLNK